MSLRYQKRIRVLPFLWVNLSKTGFSVTVGGRYLKINMGRRGVWLTGSAVGTGLSYRKKISTSGVKSRKGEKME